MESYGKQQQLTIPQSDPQSDWNSPQTGLEESMRQLVIGGGSGSKDSYPERPGEPNCVYYIRTGSCGYGARCHFNHPRNRTSVILKEGGEYPEREGQPVCQYYLKTGTCKFGTSCKFHHPKYGGGSFSTVSLNYHGYPLRPKYVLSLDGPVVTAVGFKDELAVVTHASHSLPSNDQMLEFKVFNISNGTLPLSGRLPLTPGSSLSWFGFSEEGQLSSYDSKGMLRVFTNQYGGSWIPLFSASKEKKSEERYWMVGLNASKVFCIVCKSPDIYPPVTPKPVLTLLNLSFPLASSDLGAGDLENEFILSNLYLSQAQKEIEKLAALGLDISSEDDEALTLETSLDRCILRLIATCCNADKLVRATELVRLLSSEKSVKGAIKLVTALKLPVLAERFSSILEEKMLNDTPKETTPNSISKAALSW